MSNKFEIAKPHIQGAIHLLQFAVVNNDPKLLMRAKFKILDAKELLQ